MVAQRSIYFLKAPQAKIWQVFEATQAKIFQIYLQTNRFSIKNYWFPYDQDLKNFGVGGKASPPLWSPVGGISPHFRLSPPQSGGDWTVATWHSSKKRIQQTILYKLSKNSFNLDFNIIPKTYLDNSCILENHTLLNMGIQYIQWRPFSWKQL